MLFVSAIFFYPNWSGLLILFLKSTFWRLFCILYKGYLNELLFIVGHPINGKVRAAFELLSFDLDGSFMDGQYLSISCTLESIYQK